MKLQGSDISLRHLRTTHQIKLAPVSVYVCRRINVSFSDNAFSLFVPILHSYALLQLLWYSGLSRDFLLQNIQTCFFRICTHSSRSISGIVSHGSFATKVRQFI